MPAYELTMGTPCWVDLTSTDLEATKGFYTALFGWSFEDMGEEFGHYNLISVGDDVVGGSMQYDAEFMGPEPNNAWSPYFATKDVAASGKKAEELGGKVTFQPMQVGDQGWNSELLDPGGVPFGLWQPDARKGFDRWGEHGFPGWFELHTRDYDRAVTFYTNLLGAEPQVAPLEDDQRYVSLMINNKATSGIWDIVGVLSDDAPVGWNVCLVVDDEEAALAAVKDNGGKALSEPEPIQYGRMTTIEDPTGAVFCIISGFSGI